jgi:osmotically-inducible protein OsmY
LKYFFESPRDVEGNALARKLNTQVRSSLQQNKWFRFGDVTVNVDDDGDLYLSYNVSTTEEAEEFKGNSNP